MKKNYFRVRKTFMITAMIFSIMLGMIVGLIGKGEPKIVSAEAAMVAAVKENFVTVNEGDTPTEKTWMTYADNVIVIYDNEVVDTDDGHLVENTYFFRGGQMTFTETYGTVDVEVVYGNKEAGTYFSVRK